MALRKGHCYSKVKRAYTRKSKFKKKAYIKSIPNIKIIKYDLGDLKKNFESEISLISKEKKQIRHNALESARVIINRRLNKLLSGNYHFKLRVYPHHVLRENKILTGAGADRLSQGMSQAFGKPTGTAAQVKAGQKIISVYCDKDDLDKARVALKTGISRMPCKCKVD